MIRMDHDKQDTRPSPDILSLPNNHLGSSNKWSQHREQLVLMAGCRCSTNTTLTETKFRFSLHKNGNTQSTSSSFVHNFCKCLLLPASLKEKCQVSSFLIAHFCSYMYMCLVLLMTFRLLILVMPRSAVIITGKQQLQLRRGNFTFSTCVHVLWFCNLC